MILQCGYHQRKGSTFEDCQDRADFFENNNFSIICVADGCSSTRFAAEAAEQNIRFTFDFFRNPNNWRIKAHNDMREHLLKSICEHFDAFRENTKEYAATLTAAAYSNEDDTLCFLHIGDGTVLGITENLDIFPIMYPFHVFGEKNNTVFSNTCVFVSDLMYYSVGLKKMKLPVTHKGSPLAGIVICTDGATPLLLEDPEVGYGRLRTLVTQISNGAEDAVQNLVEEIATSDYTKDDVSIAAMLFGSFRENTSVPCTKPEDTEPLPDSVPGYAKPLYLKLKDGPLSIKDIEQTDLCLKGRALETLFPLLKSGLVRYENGYYLC